jgi:hypothetical protein
MVATTMNLLLKPTIRLILLLSALSVIVLNVRSQGLTFRPFKTSMKGPQSWFLDVSYTDKPTEINAAFISLPLESQIRQINGVMTTYAVTYSNRTVIAFVTKANAAPDSIRSEVEFILSKIQTQQPGETLQHLLFHKDINRALRRVIPIDKPYGIGPENLAHFENEVVQLFGDEGVFNPTVGFYPLLRPNISVSIKQAENAALLRTEAKPALELIASMSARIPGVQFSYFRQIPFRFIDLEYSAQDLLQYGLTGSDLQAQLSKQIHQIPPSSLKKAAESFATSRVPLVDMQMLLTTEIAGSGPTSTRLADLVRPRPHHLLVSGLMGQEGGDDWLIEPLRIESPMRLDHSSSRSNGPHAPEFTFHILTTDPQANAEVIQSLKGSVLSELQEAGWMVSFIQNNDEERSVGISASSDRDLLTLVTIVTMFIAFILPAAAPGVFLFRGLSISLAVFSCLVWIVGLSLNREILATPLSLMFVYHFSTQLPVARRLHLKSLKSISSERIHIFLLLMSLPVLFTLGVFGHQFDLRDKDHILAFCLACIAVFTCSCVYRPAPPPSVRTYDEELSRTSILLKGAICLLPLLLLLFEPPFLQNTPPAIALTAQVEINGKKQESNEPLHRLQSRLASLRQMGFQSIYQAAPEEKQIVTLRQPEVTANQIRSAFIADLLASAAAGPTALISPEDSTSELALFRIVDRDQEKGLGQLGGHMNAAQTKLWLESLQVPAAVLFEEGTMQPDTRVPLASALLTELQAGVSKMIHNRGREVLLLSAFGDTIGPQASALGNEQALSAVNATLTAAGVENEHIHLRSNVNEHSLEQSSSRTLNALISVLVAFSGALFFGSVRGSLQTMATYLLCYGIAKPIFLFVYIFSGSALNVSELHLQIACIAISLALLSIWAHISADLNTSRKANQPLDRAIAPFFVEARYLYRWLLVLSSFAIVLSLSYYSFRFIAGVLLVSTIALVLLPGWVYCWVLIEEVYHRNALRISIIVAQRLKKMGGAMALVVALFCTDQMFVPPQARASDVLDTGCKHAGFVVLPFYTRPYSIDKPALDAKVTEFLASQLPCSTVAKYLLPNVYEIMQASTGIPGHTEAKKGIRNLIRTQRANIEAWYMRELGLKSQNFNVHIIGGFVEELIGHKGIVVLNDSGTAVPSEMKFTERDANVLPILKEAAQYFKDGDEASFSSESPRPHTIAIEIAPIEASIEPTQAKITERIRADLENFIRSRLTHPLPRHFLAPKSFFRIAQIGEDPKYTVRISFDASATRLFATVRTQQGNTAKSAWIEDDLMNIGEFHKQVLSSTRSALDAIEGIHEYNVNAGVSVLGHSNGMTGLFSLNARRSLGSLGLAARLRIGRGDGFSKNIRNGGAEEKGSAQSLILAGVAVGYAIMDIPWLSLDAGLSVDGGANQYEHPNTPSNEEPGPNILVTAGPYFQALATSRDGLSLLLRIGLEIPYESPVDDKDANSELIPVILDATLGFGMAF